MADSFETSYIYILIPSSPHPPPRKCTSKITLSIVNHSTNRMLPYRRHCVPVLYDNRQRHLNKANRNVGNSFIHTMLSPTNTYVNSISSLIHYGFSNME